MIPYLLAIAGGYLIGNSMNETPKFDEYADGGMMAKGGYVEYYRDGVLKNRNVFNKKYDYRLRNIFLDFMKTNDFNYAKVYQNGKEFIAIKTIKDGDNIKWLEGEPNALPFGKGGVATMDDYIKNMTDYGGRGTKRKSTPKKSDSSKFSPDLIKKLRDMGYSEEEIKKIKVIS